MAKQGLGIGRKATPHRLASYRSGLPLAAAAAGLLISMVLIGRWPRLREPDSARQSTSSGTSSGKSSETSAPTEVPALAQPPEVTVPVAAMSPPRLVARVPSPRFAAWMRILLGLSALLFWGTVAVLGAHPPGVRATGLADVRRASPWLTPSPRAHLPPDSDAELDLTVTQPSITSPGGLHARDGAAAPRAAAETISGPIEDTAHAHPIHGVVPYSEAIFDDFMDRTRR